MPTPAERLSILSDPDLSFEDKWQLRLEAAQKLAQEKEVERQEILNGSGVAIAVGSEALSQTVNITPISEVQIPLF